MNELPIPVLPFLLGQRVRQSQEHAGRVYEAVLALVVDNKDPDKLGRVKLRYPTLPGQDTSWWAPLAALGGGKDRGWFFLPEINDEVLVMFEHGDIHRPVVLGALWNGVDTPPEKNGGSNERRVLVSREGSRIVLDDDAGTVTIEDGKKTGRVVISDSKITLEAKSGDLVIQAPAGDLSAVAQSVDIQAQQGLSINGGSGVNMGADSMMSVQSPTITLSAARLDLNPGSVPPPKAATASPEDVPDPA